MSARGVSLEQDGRWSKAEEKLLQQMNAEKKFPAILNSKVNLKKVNMNVIERWINARIIQLTGIEDDIAVNTIVNLLQSPEVNPKRMQISIAAFLASHSGKFMEELWTLLVDAQIQPSGIPSTLSEGNRRKAPVTAIPIPVSSTVDQVGRTIPLNNESKSNDEIQEKDQPRTLDKERFNNRDRYERKDRNGRDSRRRSPSPFRRRRTSPSPHRRRYDDSRSRSRDRNHGRRDERNRKNY